MKKCLILIVSFLVLCLFSACENNTASDSGYYETYEDLQSFETTAAELPQNLFYNEIGISTLLNDLQGNALKAKRTYLNERFSIHGVIMGSGSNSIGDFVRVGADKDDWNYIVCYFKNDSQIDAIMDKRDGDKINIKGVVTDIDELSGYSMDIEDIFAVKDVLIRELNKGMVKNNNEYLDKDVEVAGKIVEIDDSTEGEYYIYIMAMHIWDESDKRLKVKCSLTTDEQIDMIKNAGGRNKIFVQGTVTGQENANITTLEVKYIRNLTY